MRIVRPALLVTLLLLFSALPAIAAETATPVKMSVTAGYDQRYLPGKGAPVTMLLESTAAVAGDLEISVLAPDGSQMVRSLAVEVPSGGRKQFDLALPGSAIPSPRLTVSLRDGDRVLARTNVDLISAGREVLAGVMLPQIPTGLAGIALRPTDKEIRAALLSDGRVGLGRTALEPLSYVVADADRLKALSDNARRGLFDWVSTGGRLLLAARDPSDLGWLPEAWRTSWTRQPGGGFTPDPGKGSMRGSVLVTPAGLGQVAVSPASIPEGGAIGPLAETIVAAPSGNSSRSDFGSPGLDFELLTALTSGDGSGLDLRWLMGFLIAYLLLAGPVNYLVLRKIGRKELSWVTIPLLALLFSGVAYGLVRGVRGGLQVQQASLVFATPEGQTSRRMVTVSSGSGGGRRVAFKSPDTVQPWGNNSGSMGRRLEVRQTGSGTEAVLSTSPFSVGVIEGSLSERPGYLEGELSWGGGSLAGIVTNRTQLTLDVVAAFPGRSPVELGKLAPGAAREFDLDEIGQPHRSFPSFIGPGLSEAGIKDRMRSVLWKSLRGSLGWEVSFGTPMLLGYADDYSPAVDVDGKTVVTGGPLLLASPLRTAVSREASGNLEAMSGRSELVGIDGGTFSDGTTLQLQDFRNAEFVYHLPAGIDPARVTSASLDTGADGPGSFGIDYFDFGQNKWISQGSQIGLQSRKMAASAVSPDGDVFVRFRPETAPYLELWYLGVEAVIG